MIKSVAIDGPAGAGKSTIASNLSKKTGYLYIDTGAMYRAITLKVIKNHIDLHNTTEINKLINNTNIVLREKGNIYCDDNDITDEIRSPEVSNMIKNIAKIEKIRVFLVKLQQNMAKNRSVVMEGRDITTVVLPNAKYKFFLTASVEKRAERRYKELIKKGFTIEFNKLINEIKERDESDFKIGPLAMAYSLAKKNEEIILIDSSDISQEQVVEKMYKFIKNDN